MEIYEYLLLRDDRGVDLFFLPSSSSSPHLAVGLVLPQGAVGETVAPRGGAQPLAVVAGEVEH